MSNRRKVEESLNSVSRIDFARLAAFIDGEGSIQIRKETDARSRVTPVYEFLLTVCNSDPRLPQWCKEKFGGRVYPRSRGRHRISYLWSVKALRAEVILGKCLPYILIKDKHAEIGLALRKTFTKRTGSRPISVAVVEEREILRGKLMRLSLKGKKSAEGNVIPAAAKQCG